ncbi:hypothetical protein AMECASPLE_033500 [Ameca splendens]|uniref:Uncharacterized protein n=1 Tax=Ameca splendens TaxID=208324 RepID=A0ABV0ZT83_9TELE
MIASRGHLPPMNERHTRCEHVVVQWFNVTSQLTCLFMVQKHAWVNVRPVIVALSVFVHACSVMDEQCVQVLPHHEQDHEQDKVSTEIDCVKKGHFRKSNKIKHTKEENNFLKYFYGTRGLS